MPPLILRLVTRCRRLRSAGHGWVRHEDKQFLDEPFHAPAELGLNRQGIRKGRAKTISFSSHFASARGRTEALASVLSEPPRPTEAQRLLGTTLSGHGYPAADEPSTVASGPGSGYRRRRNPDQHSAEGGIQHLIHHPLIPTPTQEVAGSAEGPNIAVAPVLAPAGFVPLHQARTCSSTSRTAVSA